MICPRQWQQLDRLVGRALELPARDREHYLAAHESSATVQAQARALLAADAHAGAFLERPVVALDGGPGTPESVGGYRIVRRLGRGGMGEVFLGEGGGGDRVAIKVLAAELHHPDFVRRFACEREILSTLDHPHIARLRDGGNLTDGRPYMVMEYISGVQLQRHCETGLGLSERLELFVEVCVAVAYAHRRRVLHLDIKPHNVLVAEAGVPVLVDFGVARRMVGGAEVAAGSCPLTPQYASPEQLRGGPLTPASDIYSLGVMLYRLTSGLLPYTEMRSSQSRSSCIAAALDCHWSSMVSGGDLCVPQWPRDEDELWRRRRPGAGDLQAIILGAVQPEPSQRYASVEHFIEDLRRYLRSVPVGTRYEVVRQGLGRLSGWHKGAMSWARLGMSVLAGVTLGRDRHRRPIEVEPPSR
ncbi:MAG: serine/threonine protein kinase [Deltaproteobacteria bacterium]|nr:serine/threonine protein kinase [Deltaproteobacteria bacterium]